MRPCSSLEGMELAGGWKVQELLKVPKADRPDDPASGGNFCAQYHVVHDSGKQAFLKALDFSVAMSAQDPAAKLYELIGDYIFERDTLDKCKERRMSNVVLPLGHGYVEVAAPGLLGKVYYLIFELADEDVRKRKEAGVMKVSCMMRSMHGSALGLQQLHAAQIAHHDIKPSNVLFINGDSKVADLGRASDRNNSNRFDSYIFSGDPTYMPFEKYWHLPYREFYDRFASDLFMLGNLLYFYFLDVPVNVLVFKGLMGKGVDLSKMTFSDALPFMIDSFENTLIDLHGAVSDLCPPIADTVVSICRELCFPDPDQRGAPGYKDKALKYRCDRYVSKFANLAIRSRR